MEIFKPVLIQAFLSETPVESLDKRVICWLAWTAEIQLDPIEIGPLVEDLTYEFRTVIHPDDLRQWSIQANSL